MRAKYNLSKLKGWRNSYAKALKKQDAEWRRLCSAVTRDSVRVSVPRAFLPMLTLFFHHVSDAMTGDDRPDHGLAMLKKG